MKPMVNLDEQKLWPHLSKVYSKLDRAHEVGELAKSENPFLDRKCPQENLFAKQIGLYGRLNPYKEKKRWFGKMGYSPNWVMHPRPCQLLLSIAILCYFFCNILLQLLHFSTLFCYSPNWVMHPSPCQLPLSVALFTLLTALFRNSLLMLCTYFVTSSTHF